MTNPPADGSRDRRIEDPTNLWLIHPAARALLRPAIRLGVSANMVSLAGLAFGVAASQFYVHWTDRVAIVAGLVCSVAWLIADGLDGMVARATGTASAVGRFFDGVVDHGVFILIYVSLATAIGTVEGWALALTAGAAHAVQSILYEGERARFHRRARGIAMIAAPRLTGHWLMRGYDRLATRADRTARRFEHRLASSPDPQVLGRDYAAAAAPGMHWMALLSANCRVWLIFLACLAGNPRLFWWAEIVPLTLVAAVTMRYQRKIEDRFAGPSPLARGTGTAAFSPGQQGQ